MCGILGIGGAGVRPVVEQLLCGLAHRGPDGEGIWSSPDVTLGHRRLAIIGTDAGGRQPMVGRRGSILVFNGEIYNYLELADRLCAAGVATNRRYDTAVLLDALETWGLNVLPDLNGMFAFAWFQPERRQLALVRDRWGKKPLFWGQVRLPGASNAVAFSSELRTFTRLPGGPPPPDGLGVLRYLVYDGMPDDRTVYRGVFKVPAASYVILDPDGQVGSRGTYWRFQPAPAPVTSSSAVAAVTDDLQRAVALRLRSDVPVGLFLSGGLDSSLLASLWRRTRPDETIRTFTVGFDDESYDERAPARLMAAHVGAHHSEMVLNGSALEREVDDLWEHLDEPFADPSLVPTSFLCRFARSQVKVALAGEGGDEIQAGYDPFRAWRMSRAMESVLPRGVWHRLLRQVESRLRADSGNMSLQFKVRHFAQGFLEGPDARIQCWMASFPLPLALQALKPELTAGVDTGAVLDPTRRAYQAVEAAGSLQAQMHVWMKTYLEASILTKVDRAGMMHGLEVRSPFLDPVAVARMANLPDRLIYHRGRGKVLLREAAHSLLPAPVLQRPKKGFGVPQATWLRTVLRDRMEEAVRRSKTEGWFRHDVVSSMWRAHLAGKSDFRRALWNFLWSFPFQR